MDEKTFSLLSDTDRHAFQVGHLVRTWAFAEGALDLSCVVVFHHLSGSERPDELPRALNRKLSFLRTCLLTMSDDIPLSRHGVDVVDCTAEASDFRHLCVHGLPLDDASDFVVQIFKRLPTDLLAVEKRVTTADIAKSQVQATMILMGMVCILLRLCDRAQIVGQSEQFLQLPADLHQHQNSTKLAKRLFSSLQKLGAA